jgi:alpha-tubulin suppressor-like RCC1 family protein
MSKKITAIACGSHHSLALSSEHDLYAWGQNNCGQMGTGTTTNQSTPKKIVYSFSAKQVKIINVLLRPIMRNNDNRSHISSDMIKSFSDKFPT